MTLKNLHACIFDLDGVLVDTAKYHYYSWKRLADSLTIHFDEEMNEQLKGVSRVQSLNQILNWGDIEFNEEKKAELRELKNEWYLEYLEELGENEILPFAHEFLIHTQSNGIKIALGSASKNAVKVLQKTNLIGYFDAIIDGTNTVKTKPDPEVFLNAASAINVKPKNAIVFEDSERGIEAANSGKFKSVGIGDKNILSQAQMVIPSFENISLEYFKELFEE